LFELVYEQAPDIGCVSSAEVSGHAANAQDAAL